MDVINLFAKLNLEKIDFDGSITATTPDQFIAQFKKVCSCQASKHNQSIVYVWHTEKAISRLRGKSTIVYIGKTDATFYTRHYRYAETEASGNNWKRYSYIINQYGAIGFCCARIPSPNTPLEIENRLLQKYFEEHLELPPINKSL